jgi:hypothetical protein
LINLEDIKGILTQANEHTLSLYLNVNPAERENQASTPAWRIALKNALKDIESNLTDEQALKTWKDVRARAEAQLEFYQPDARTLVLFVSPDNEFTYSLPITLENRASFGKPLVTPLLWAIEEYKTYLVIMVDQEKADFFTAYLGSAGIEERMELDLEDYDFGQKTLMPSTAAIAGGFGLTQGSNREAYQDMINEHVERFHRDVIARAQALKDQHQVTRIIIGGDEHAAHALHGLMPEKLARSVIRVQPIPMRSAPHQIVPTIAPIALEFERQRELELVQQVIDLAKSGGRGVLGRDKVLEALGQQRVELLIAPWPMDDTTLATELPLSASESSASIELVHGEAAELLQAEGGLAARLYYTI